MQTAECQHFATIPRRTLLRLGAGLLASGWALPERWSRYASAASGKTKFGHAKSCILVYLLGGPPHQDMFDLKPDAPAEIRGPFRPIATNVRGVEICEHLPRLATMADRFALVRSVSHANSNHTPMIYYTLTGRETQMPEQDNDVRPPQRDDFPHIGSMFARFKPSVGGLPAFVAIPEVAVRSSSSGEFKRTRQPLRGGGAGILGPRYVALGVNGSPESSDAIESLNRPDDVSEQRLESRARLLSALEGTRPQWSAARDLNEMRKTAVELTGAASARNLNSFDIHAESSETQERYGRHRFGQSMLLARRLAEAGVPMIAIHWNEMTVCDGWDTHSKNFEALKEELLPMLDQGLSALLSDLDQRGMLDETLVVCMGEFGRTPTINSNAGRDHWGHCSTTLLAGGGICGSQAYGASDKHAAYPICNAVDPVDVHATMFHLMGIDCQKLTVRDRLERPLPISTGTVIREII